MALEREWEVKEEYTSHYMFMRKQVLINEYSLGCYF